MGAIQERLVLDLDTVKNFVRASDADNEIIEFLVDAAKEEADNYCNNPFLSAYGEELPIPSAVKLWCLKWIARNYERRQSGLTSEQMSGLGSTSWGEVEFDELMPYRIYPGT